MENLSPYRLSPGKILEKIIDILLDFQYIENPELICVKHSRGAF